MFLQSAIPAEVAGLVPRPLFDPNERGPAAPSLRLRLEALDQLDPDEHAAVLAMIEGTLLRHQVRQLDVTHPTAS